MEIQMEWTSGQSQIHGELHGERVDSSELRWELSAISKQEYMQPLAASKCL